MALNNSLTLTSQITPFHPTIEEIEVENVRPGDLVAQYDGTVTLVLSTKSLPPGNNIRFQVTYLYERSIIDVIHCLTDCVHVI